MYLSTATLPHNIMFYCNLSLYPVEERLYYGFSFGLLLIFSICIAVVLQFRARIVVAES